MDIAEKLRCFKIDTSHIRTATPGLKCSIAAPHCPRSFRKQLCSFPHIAYSFFLARTSFFCTQDMNILINCFIFISHLTLFFPADSHTAIDALLKIHCQRRLSSSLNSLCPQKAASCSLHQALTRLFNCFSTPIWYLHLPPTPVFLI